MGKISRFNFSLFLLILVAIAVVFAQTHINAYAMESTISNYEIITVTGTDGQPINVSGGLSRDGNVLLFLSNAINLPNPGGSGYYAYNIKNKTVARIDVSTSGVLPNGATLGSFKMSTNGRYVTFVSMATNLDDGSVRPQQSIYKRDIQAGVTTFVGSGYSGGLSQNWDKNLDLSDDGRFALVASRYIDNSYYPHSYGIVYGDGLSGSYTWNSLARGVDVEGSSNGSSTAGRLSCDGSFAVYTTYGHIELADLRSGNATTVLTGEGWSSSPLISCNGRYVLYATTNRTDIPTPAGMNSNQHLVRYDRITKDRLYIDSDSAGVFSTGVGYNSSSSPADNAFNASIADTGDVIFQYNGFAYLKHLSDESGLLEPVAKKTTGEVVNIAIANLSSDGRYVSFVIDPYDLGITEASSIKRAIRAKTGI